MALLPTTCCTAWHCYNVLHCMALLQCAALHGILTMCCIAWHSYNVLHCTALLLTMCSAAWHDWPRRAALHGIVTHSLLHCRQTCKSCWTNVARCFKPCIPARPASTHGMLCSIAGGDAEEGLSGLTGKQQKLLRRCRLPLRVVEASFLEAAGPDKQAALVHALQVSPLRCAPLASQMCPTSPTDVHHYAQTVLWVLPHVAMHCDTMYGTCPCGCCCERP